MTTVAISFSGLPRIVPRALDCWQHLISKYNTDVFMHVWDTGDNSAQFLCERFSPVSCFIEKPRQFLYANDYKLRTIHSDPYNVFSMWSSIYESMNMIKQREQLYDIVVRARFDVEFDHQLELVHNNEITIPGKSAEVYEYRNEKYPGWHDMMAYGSLDNMAMYADTLNVIPRIYSEGSPFYSEFFLSTHLHRIPINVTHYDIYADIVRH